MPPEVMEGAPFATNRFTYVIAPRSTNAMHSPLSASSVEFMQHRSRAEVVVAVDGCLARRL